MDNRRKAHYKGDLRGHLEGKVMGPNTLGEWLVVEETKYDEVTNTTTAIFGYATKDQVEART